MDAPNPFTERGIIRDPKRFFGRKHELRQIFERLAAMQSVSIVGERRIGKSSLLAVIAATGPDRLGQEHEFHYIDLERVESTEDFIARALDALHTEGETIRDLERAIQGRKVVLCLDEFEQSGEFSKEFFGALRSLASTGHLALVAAVDVGQPHFRAGAHLSGEGQPHPIRRPAGPEDAFRALGHYLSSRGARHGLNGADWTYSACDALTAIRRLHDLPSADRMRAVEELAVRLGLAHLTRFYRRTADWRA